MIALGVQPIAASAGELWGGTGSRTTAAPGQTRPVQNATSTYRDTKVRLTSLQRPGDAARAQSDRLLVEARMAMAVGDLRRASAKLGEAERLNVGYDVFEDSPGKVRATLQKYEQLLAEKSRGGGDTESYRRRYAELLMEQAESLLKWREFNEAERLAGDARRLGVRYNPFDMTPDRLLDRIAEARAAHRNPQEMHTWDPHRLNRNAGQQMPNLQAAATPKAQAVQMVNEARQALIRGEFDLAERIAQQAKSLRVNYAPREDRPELVLLDVAKARQSQGQGNPAARRSSLPPSQPAQSGQPAFRAPQGQMRQVNFQMPAPGSDAMTLFIAAEEALEQGLLDQAMELYRRAYAKRRELDPSVQQRLQDKLQMLAQKRRAEPIKPGNMLEQEAAAHNAVTKQLSAEVSKKQYDARRLKESDPKRALQVLNETREIVTSSAADAGVKSSLTRRLDRQIKEIEKYIQDNQAMLDLRTRNQQVKQDNARQIKYRVEVEEKLARMVEDFNKLMDEERFREAQLIAKRASVLAPEQPVVQQMNWKAKFASGLTRELEIKSAKERGFVDVMASIEESSVPFDDRNPLVFPDVRRWKQLTGSRQALERRRQRYSESELEILSKLNTPVQLKFNNKPLQEVIDYLAALAEINIHLDPQGLSEEGVLTTTPVTINLSHPISLKSALNLILNHQNLGWVIKDEVLKVTSIHHRDGEVYQEVYNVADLVIPIPNFVPSGRMGLSQAIHEAIGATGSGPMGSGRHAPVTVLAGHNGGSQHASINPNVLANPDGYSPGGGATLQPGAGPGGLGGGVQPDFDSLIELITSTVAPQSWDDVGGPGSISPFETNLSLVISQTQAVHEQIADLLDQLRRLQDLQVTIEVRFITLNDNFFERIGIDFDFEVDDDIDRPFQTFGQPFGGFVPVFGQTEVNPPRNLQDRDHDNGAVSVGLQGPGKMFSADLDIPFRQGSFDLAQPQFGGFQTGAGAQLGFAILSDLEAFFFMEASQGDTRSNVLQAPKVTLFNGQLAFVADTSQSPFVISVVPVVGDFAAGFQPVIAVLSEGTFLTVQAVVSSDRRFVRLTLVPFFSSIGNVDEFTFQGSETTTTSTSNEENGADDSAAEAESETVSRSGTTVQLPTFSFVTVTTTVSVPDGGTVLLGGVKRLSEGRNEFGVPILNKLPYVNRLFRNVGIGRETQSLMMMVTPRIIIQEEEEALLLGGSSQ